MSHQEIWSLIVGYSLVGFFVACLIAGTLAAFKIIEIDEDLRKYIFITLIASVGGVFVAYLSRALQTPSGVQDKLVVFA
jgi:hypothetical protein